MEDMFDGMSFRRVSVVSVSVSFQGLEDSFFMMERCGANRHQHNDELIVTEVKAAYFLFMLTSLTFLVESLRYLSFSFRFGDDPAAAIIINHHRFYITRR